ncbi:hypothetical protein FH972_012062 [Carpinus fangiana]|uniref:YTH domain-containing protein n=1 Tax=Carpinus fangiana TaxID=176857 RepID=A0A5N6R503_9ROSI|nr:hypothetical protein FH972_012062 [Carpinus fangiana]KAE8055205.1 hypothetical protein FH972_012062 [Carpinus fangiana]
MNEPILEEAFHNSDKVILIFSVNMSGFFQGYAQMMSSVGWRRDNVWSQGSGKNSPWGRSFKVKWLQLNDLPFQKTLHLKNPLNDYKPVKISRDCQELSLDIGEALCELLDGKSDVDDSMSSFYRNDLPSKRLCVESPCSLGDEDYNVPQTYMSWSRTPMLYPSLLYPHQADANRFHLANQSSTGVIFPKNLPITTGASKVERTKHSRISGDLTNLQVDVDMSSHFDVWGLSAESPFASTLTEDDFLEMSYEEYLEAHSRSSKQLSLPVKTGCKKKKAKPMETTPKIGKDEVIAKVKDDGDFDRLRLKIIRKAKDNEVLRNEVISMVRQSAALNRAGAENMKPRQLSDAIHDEIRNEANSLISDALWEIIKSRMKGEIIETVQSVYDKLANPKVKEEGESSTNGMMLIRKEAENNGSIIASASEMDGMFSDSEPKEPPGFSLFNGHQNNTHEEQHKQELQPPMSHERGLIEEQKDNTHCSQDVLELEETDLRVLPGSSADKELKQPSDDTDEDPDLPPGFG